MSSIKEIDMPFLALLFAFLLKPKSDFARAIGYTKFYYNTQEKVVAWHKRELERLDFRYCFQQEGLRLVASKKKLQKME
jgi:hypothetical protein